MFLSALAHSIGSVDLEERRERLRRRRAERERIEREIAAIRERQTVKPNPLILELHKRVDALGIEPSLLAEFKSLPENEQRRYDAAADDSFVQALPVYLAIVPGQRWAGLRAARKSKLPFVMALEAHYRELTRSVADDDEGLL